MSVISEIEDARYCPTDLSRLHYDTACLQVHNDLNQHVDLYFTSSECIQCDATYWSTVPLKASVSLVVPAVHAIHLSAIEEGAHTDYCQQTTQFTQHELVSWNITDDGCLFTVVREGDNIYKPLYVLFACLTSVIILTVIGRAIYRSQWLQNLFIRQVNIDLQNDLGNPSSSSDSLPLVQSELVPLRRLSTARIQALDTFRGLTIALMIFVNYGGGKYWFFQHSAWNGLTFADFVFPWFAWIMGVSLVLSYRSKLRSCLSRCAVLLISARRALVLLTLGLLENMYQHNDLSTARFCGVLQRLAVAFFIISSLEIVFMKKQPNYERSWCLEVWDCWPQWLVVLALVYIQVSVTFYLAVPGCPKGYIGPGGVSNHSQAPNCTGGAARYIDSWVFGDHHLYPNLRLQRLYHTTLPYDPEGILGTLTTCLTVYLGVQAGYIILTYNSTRQRVFRWLFWALLTGVVGGCLCGWSQEGGLIPVNKPLWSLSFALVTSAAGFLLLALLFLVIDSWHAWSGAPFRHAGMNAILLYMGHIVTRNTFPWSWKPVGTTDHSGLLAMNTGAITLWLAIAVALHNNEVFLTI